MINFFFHLDSLGVLNINKNQTELLNDLLNVKNIINERNDKLSLPSDTYDKGFHWGTIVDLFEEDIFPWLDKGSSTYQLFVYEFLCSSQSEHSSFNEFQENYPKKCGLVGLLYNPKPIEEYIHDYKTLMEFYCLYYSEYQKDIDWDNSKVLPNIEYSNQYLLDYYNDKYPDYSDFSDDEKIELYNEEFPKDGLNDDLKLKYFNEKYLENYKKLSDGEKLVDFFINKYRAIRANRGDLEEIAKEVARRNYYRECVKLSSDEQRLRDSFRTILKISKDGKDLYISLDYENGLWEVCDEKGSQIGAYNYFDEEKEEAEVGHDILSLKK